MAPTCLIPGLAALTIPFPEAEGIRILPVHVPATSFGPSFRAIFLVPAGISHRYSDGKTELVFAFGNVALEVGGVVGNLFRGYGKEITGSFGILYPTVPIAALLSAVIATALPREVENGCGRYSRYP